jgi:hypothetical protein
MPEIYVCRQCCTVCRLVTYGPQRPIAPLPQRCPFAGECLWVLEAGAPATGGTGSHVGQQPHTAITREAILDAIHRADAEAGGPGHASAAAIADAILAAVPAERT